MWFIHTDSCFLLLPYLLFALRREASSLCNSSIFIYIFAAVSVGFLFGYTVNQTTSISKPYFDKRQFQSVRRMSVDEKDSNKLAAKMARDAIPTILTFKNLQNEWPAFSRWNVSYIRDKIKTFPSVYEGKKKTFLYFDDSKPMASLSSVLWKSPFKVSDMDTETFFSKIEHSSKGHDDDKKDTNKYDDKNTETQQSYFYFSGNLEHLPQLQGDIGDTDMFAYTQEGKVTNVWIGQSGVTAQAHYDSFHNFYVQITGEKRFLLVAPNNHKKMYLYPRSHPSYRQSQINFDEFTSFDWPLFKGVNVYEAYLRPGDVLYLPPYWFHHVQAINNSMSVNIWCDSFEYTTTTDIWISPLPFEEDWNYLKRIQVVSTFSLHLIEFSLQEMIDMNASGVSWGSHLALEFLRSLVQSRFEKLFGDPYKYDSREWPALKCYDTFKDEGLLNKVKSSAFDLAIKFRQLSYPIRELYLANFLEDMIVWSVGVEQLYPFLASCLKLHR